MIYVNHDQDGTVTGISYDDDPFEDLDSFPDWISEKSPVRSLK
jgi:hypothetical protein